MLTAEKVLVPHLGAITHVDYTARVQVVKDGFIWDLLTALKSMGQPAVIVNTSFNAAGEPLVHDADGAIRTFKQMKFDYLLIEQILYKEV